MKIGQRRCEEEKRKKRNTREEDFEIFVEAVSGRQKTKVLGMTSRGSEGGSEEDGNKEIGHCGNNEESPLSGGYEEHARNRMDEMGANAVRTRCYT